MNVKDKRRRKTENTERGSRIRSSSMSFLLILGLLFSTAPAQNPSPDPVALAQRLFKQGKFREAAAAYRAIINKDKTASVAYAGLVQSYLKADDVKAADESSSEALALLPQSALIHAIRGDVYFRKGRLSDAEDQYKSALTLDEKCARAWLGMGRVYTVVSRPGQAKDTLFHAHQLDPDDGDILFYWSITLTYPDNVKALEKYLAEYRLDPEDERRKREYLEFIRAVAGRDIWVPVKNIDHAEIKLESVIPHPGQLLGLAMKATVNGKAGVFLLDTGASWLTISRKLAEKIGARKLSEQVLEGTGEGRAAKAYLAWVDRVAIGDLEFHDCVVHVSTGPTMDGADGLVGLSILNHNLVTLDVPHRRLTLDALPARGDDSSRPLVRPFLPDSSLATQIFTFGHIVLLNTQVNQKTVVLFVLDTGANNSFLSRQLAEQLGKVRHSNMQVAGMSGSAGTPATATDTVLQFSNMPQPPQDFVTTDLHSISRNLGTEVSGLIGISTLRQMKVTINYRDGWVKFQEGK